MKMNRDFVEMLSAFSRVRADFLVVGAYAVAAHGRPRATGDLDIWVRAAPDNATKVMAALKEFGAPLFGLTLKELSEPGIVLQIGQVPCRIDVLTKVSGISFEEAWPNKVVMKIDGLEVPFIGLEDLIRNKRAVGRAKDLADIESLTM